MRGRLTAALPVATGAAAVVFLFAPLAAPDSVLAVRDLPIFHLPLRTAFAAAAAEGIPAWNPSIHGGQPILSNPNYAAFYPPTWLGLVLAPHTAIHLVLLLHAVWAFAGSWRLARRLGCERAPAAFAATAFAGGGAFVASASSLTPFCGVAWLPWILLWSGRLFEGERPRARRLVPVAAGFALQFLAGEPVIVATTGLAVVCLASRRPRRAPRRWAALALAAGLAMGLAAVQLVPAAARLAESSRAKGLEAAEVTTWSTPPARLVESVFPRFYGDPMRADRDLYFGWRLHDRGFPYLVSIYPGLLALLLAFTALARWPVRWRAAWAAMALAGLFLALGRNNPLIAAAAELTPWLRLFRYPEKFLLLTTSAVAFSAALGWQQLLERRRRGDRGAADLPLALAALVTAVAGLFAVALAARPELGRWFARQQSLLPQTPERLEEIVAYLRAQAWLALAVAVAALALLAAYRLRRPRESLLVPLTVLLLAADLAYHGRTLLPTVPYSQLRAQGELAARLAADADRVFVDSGFARRTSLDLRGDRPGPLTLGRATERLDPYVGNLWGLSYALNEDTDRMLTGWSRFALGSLREVWEQPEVARRLLGSWGVDHIVRTVPLRERLGSRWRGEPDSPARVLVNPDHLPRLRFVPRVAFHPDRERAADAALQDGFRLARRDHWVDPGRAGAEATSALDTRAWDLSQGHRRLALAYQASAPTYLVVATTFDRGWRARVDGEAVALYPTGAGQIGVEVPPGEHRVELVYRDRRVTAGAAISLAAAAALAWLGRRRQRR